MVKLSDYVFDFIARQGVKHVFTLPGGGAMHLVDSLGKRKDLRTIGMLHEQAVAIAAEAYAMFTNNLGVGLVTTGPGGTNTVTGVAAAWIDSTPCFFISGQVKRSDLMKDSGVRQLGLQEIDIISIVKPITKYAVTILEPSTIRYHLEKAAYLARTGRPGPVWLDIPLDVQGSIIDELSLNGFEPGTIKVTEGSINEQIDTTIQFLNKSERPVIIAGNGIRLSGAREGFINFIEQMEIPVLTTWKAIDLLPNDHPLNAGKAGTMGERGSNFTLQNSDLLLCLGSRLDISQTGFDRSTFARAAKKVVVDIDINELNKLDIPFDVPVCADVGVFINKFMRKKNNIKRVNRSTWINRIQEWRKRYPIVLKEFWDTKDYVNPYVFIDVLSKELTENDIIVPCSAGTAAEITFQALKVKYGQRVTSNHGFGAMGFDLPASIGACIASGCRRTVCIAGDGGVQLNIQELETIQRLNLPIKLFIINNNGYASIRATQRNYFEGRYVCSDLQSGLSIPNILSVSHAYKISAERISSHDELTPKIKEVLSKDGPVICDILTIPDFTVSPKVFSKRCKDGTMMSLPIEDLWPFLDREEFLSNMIIPPVDNIDD